MCVCIYICLNVCVCLNAYICIYAHLHFWSIISIIYGALYCNVYHLFVCINWIVWSKSWINDSPHIPVPFELSIHLIKIGEFYMEPLFSSYASILCMFFTLELNTTMHISRLNFFTWNSSWADDAPFDFLCANTLRSLLVQKLLHSIPNFSD